MSQKLETIIKEKVLNKKEKKQQQSKGITKVIKKEETQSLFRFNDDDASLNTEIPTLTPGDTLRGNGNIIRMSGSDLNPSSIMRAAMFTPTTSLIPLFIQGLLDSPNITEVNISLSTANEAPQLSFEAVHPSPRMNFSDYWENRFSGIVKPIIPQVPKENDPLWRDKIDPRLEGISPTWYYNLVDYGSGQTLNQLATQTFQHENSKLMEGANLGDGMKCVVGEAHGGNNDYWENCDTCSHHSNKLYDVARMNNTVKFVQHINDFTNHFINVHQAPINTQNTINDSLKVNLR